MAHDKDRALEPIEFIGMLNAVDDFYGQPFLLLDWQHDTLWDVYGTIDDRGYRQYKYTYLEVPKKNGKTSLIAAIALYHLICDGPGGQIFCCAADRGQAELVYKAACGMMEQNPDLQDVLKLTASKKEIKNTLTGTTLKVLSAEAFTKHGLNPTVVIFDELHAQPNRNLWDVMTFGAGAARKEPLWWVITTAGDDPDRHSIGWEIHEKAEKIKDGEQINPAWYVKIFNAPEEADIFDEDIWYAANPSLGKTISIESVRQEALEARNSESSEKLFRWLRLNQWVSLKRIGWLPLTLWDTTEGKWNPAELIGKRCYAGLDLSSTTDLTALKLLFPPQDGFDDWREISEAWIPEDSMKERVARDGVPYDHWVKSKHLNVTPGNAVDYEFVEARILAVNQQYDIQMLGTDPWNSRMLTQRLEKGGVKLYEVPQNKANMSPAMKEQERLMRTGKYTHEHNPAARWCFGNTNVAVDGNNNIKPMKNKSVERIDIAVAGIIAMAVAIQMGATVETKKPGVFFF
jgi:phage terminase large subunit-like protein